MKLRVGVVRFATAMMILLGASSAFADDKLFTVSSYDDVVSGPTKGTTVVDESGKHYIIKDEFFAEMANNNDPIAFGAELGHDGRTLEVHWVKAVVNTKIKLKDGTVLPVGTELKIFGKKDSHPVEDEDMYSAWHVILPNGKKAWLSFDDEYSVDMIPAKSGVHGDRIEGLVREQGQDIFLEKMDGSRVKITGASSAALKGDAGKFVVGYGTYFDPSRSFEFQQLEGGTLRKTKALRSLAANSKKEDLDNADLAYVVRADKPGYYTLRHNWSGIGPSAGVSTAYVKRADVSFADRWVELTGKISVKTVDNEEIYSIQGANQTLEITSGSSNIGDFLLKPYIGKSISVAGNIVSAYPLWDRNKLEIRKVTGVVASDIAADKEHDTPALKAGTPLTIIGRDNQGLILQLANGKLGHFQEDWGFSLTKISFTSTSGMAAAIPGAP